VLAQRKRPGDAAEASALAVSAAAMAAAMGLRPLAERSQRLSATLAGTGVGPLTKREGEIAVLVARGLTNRQIAAAAHISERTVETHVQHIIDKLGVANRTQVATRLSERPATDTYSG
jgi:DNA-binding NarL/FixJ family response regulator